MMVSPPAGRGARRRAFRRAMMVPGRRGLVEETMSDIERQIDQALSCVRRRAWGAAVIQLDRAMSLARLELEAKLLLDAAARAEQSGLLSEVQADLDEDRRYGGPDARPPGGR